MNILTATLHNSNRIEFDYRCGEKLKIKLTNVWKKQEAFVELNSAELEHVINVCKMRLEEIKEVEAERQLLSDEEEE